MPFRRDSEIFLMVSQIQEILLVLILAGRSIRKIENSPDTVQIGEMFQKTFNAQMNCDIILMLNIGNDYVFEAPLREAVLLL
jgi:hypothetical protein